MPPPPKTIDAESALPAYRYLLAALRDPRRRFHFVAGTKRGEALAELEALVPAGLLDDVLAGNTTPHVKLELLQAWCDRWLEQEALTRMWRALRQQVYKARHRTKQVTLPQGVYLRLSIYAEDEQLTLGEAVDRLVKLAGNGKT